MQDFRNLEIWQLGYNLALEVYEVTRTFPREEMYGMTSQMRRCAVSIPSNIAEGTGRQSDADFRRFLFLSMGSAAELDCQSMLARDLGILNGTHFDRISSRLGMLRRKLNALIQRLDPKSP